MIGQRTLFQPDVNLPLRQRIHVETITLAEARFVLENYHYLRRTRVGRQINYSICIDGMIDGVVTFAYPMISSPLNGIPPDEIIEFARMYLYSNISHMASCAIGKVLRRIKGDWMYLFPNSKVPKMVVSWSDTIFHDGTIYKASNFQHYRRSKGRSHNNSIDSKRGMRDQHDDYRHDKDCWIYML